jgi:hypothetical protein
MTTLITVLHDATQAKHSGLTFSNDIDGIKVQTTNSTHKWVVTVISRLGCLEVF